MIALAALALAAGEPSAALRAVLDRPYMLKLDEERSISGRLHHFTAERRVVFRRDGDGLVAEVTLVALGEDMGGEAGRRFLAAAGALRGRTLRFRLDTTGRLLDIDDEAAVWAAIVAALPLAGRSPSGPAVVAAPDAAMAALPAAARRGMIASILMPVIAGVDVARAPGSQRVSMASRSIAAGPPLSGVETVSVDANATLRIAAHASAADAAMAVSVDRERVIDPGHGLVVRREETQTVRIPGAGTQVTRTITTLVPPV